MQITTTHEPSQEVSAYIKKIVDLAPELTPEIKSAVEALLRAGA